MNASTTIPTTLVAALTVGKYPNNRASACISVYNMDAKGPIVFLRYNSANNTYSTFPKGQVRDRGGLRRAGSSLQSLSCLLSSSYMRPPLGSVSRKHVKAQPSSYQGFFRDFAFPVCTSTYLPCIEHKLGSRLSLSNVDLAIDGEQRNDRLANIGTGANRACDDLPGI